MHTIPAYTALTYEQYGPPSLLSLLWQELDRCRTKQDLKNDRTVPFNDLEFYKPIPSGYPRSADAILTELHMPVLVQSQGEALA